MVLQGNSFRWGMQVRSTRPDLQLKLRTGSKLFEIFLDSTHELESIFRVFFCISNQQEKKKKSSCSSHLNLTALSYMQILFFQILPTTSLYFSLSEMGNIHKKSILYTIYRYSQIFSQNIQ